MVNKNQASGALILIILGLSFFFIPFASAGWFGTQTTGGATQTPNKLNWLVTNYTLSTAPVLITHIWFYGASHWSTTDFAVAIYDDDGAGGNPGTRLGYSAPTPITYNARVNQWHQIELITPVLLASTGRYWLGVACEDDLLRIDTFGVATSITYREYTGSITPPATYPASPDQTYTWEMVIYAEWGEWEHEYDTLSVNTTVAGDKALFTARLKDANMTDGYIFSYNNGAGWVNETWYDAVDNVYVTAQNELTLNAVVGTHVSFKWWFNDTLSVAGWTDTFEFDTTNLHEYCAYLSSTIDNNCDYIQVAVDRAETDYLVNGGEPNATIPVGIWQFATSDTYWDMVEVPVGVNVRGKTTASGVHKGKAGMPINLESILTMQYEAANSTTFFTVIGDENPIHQTEISYLKLVGWRYYTPSSINRWIGITVRDAFDFRIHNCWIQDLCGNAVAIWASTIANPNVLKCMNGVIDHCILNNTWGNPGFMGQYPSLTLTYGIAMQKYHTIWWETPIQDVQGHYLNYTVVIEDNVFGPWRHATSSKDNFIQVARHNLFDGCYGIAEIDAHGSYADPSNPLSTGTRSLECYENIFQNVNNTWIGANPWAINLRGGSGIIFNNTIDASYNGGLIDLNNDFGNYDPYRPDNHIMETYIWGNTLSGKPLIHYNSDNTEGVHYFLYQPTVGTAGYEYVPIDYPHPLVTGKPLNDYYDLTPTFNVGGAYGWLNVTVHDPKYNELQNTTIVVVCPGAESFAFSYDYKTGIFSEVLDTANEVTLDAVNSVCVTTGRNRAIALDADTNMTCFLFQFTSLVAPGTCTISVNSYNTEGLLDADTPWQTFEAQFGWVGIINKVINPYRIFGIPMTNVVEVNQVP